VERRKRPIGVWVSGELVFFSIFGPQKSRQNGRPVVLFDIALVSRYVVNEVADDKLNSMDSVDIENVVSMC